MLRVSDRRAAEVRNAFGLADEHVTQKWDGPNYFNLAFDTDRFGKARLWRALFSSTAGCVPVACTVNENPRFLVSRQPGR